MRIDSQNGIQHPKGGRMRQCLFFAFALFGWLLTSLSAYGTENREVIVEQANGNINWTRGWIQATGTGVASGAQSDSTRTRKAAERNAWIAARNNLLQVLESINIDSNRTVGQLLNEKPDIRIKLIAIVDALRPPEPPEIGSDGSAVIRLRMTLHGPFAQLILPADIKQIEPIKRVSPIRPSPASTAENAKGTKQADRASEQKPPVHSGMIVDAKGLSEVKPAMVPKIVDETGKEIYGPAFVSREYAIQSGMSSYMKDLALARENVRVKPNPLIVKGLKTKSLGRSVIVVSNADASKLRHAYENLSVLKQCRVIILLD